ncbi:MAG: 6-carboxytetrahydropterin synthase [Phycisphaerales bacterium]|nr:6-carboxytetrahydropterin synthase [Phycisphaerales bacterium]
MPARNTPPATLTRAVRIVVCRNEKEVAQQRAHNTFAGFPSTSELGAWFQFNVAVSGVPDANTGYLATLAQLDGAVRDAVMPILRDALFGTPTKPDETASQSSETPSQLLHRMAHATAAALGREIDSLTFNLSPYHTYRWDRTMNKSSTLSAMFEFAASHRLNDPTRSATENAAFFGKCNKLNGHGHNYRLEASIRVPTGFAFGMAELEAVVDRCVIERFDHMNLNVDCPEFHTFNPSVEHIAGVCFDLLKPEFHALGVELLRVRLWETSKTSATIEA